MHALIVIAHHNPKSLTHSLALQVAEGIELAGAGHTYEVVDLYAQGFDPRFTAADLAVHHQVALPPADVAAEQARLDRADALVLVFPIYWWSMPALLKGWIDRVFANGWAFDFSTEARLVKNLQHLQVHLLGLGGADGSTYERHGYADAMDAQINHGIFNYCGAPVVTSERLLDSETLNPEVHLATARTLGQTLFSSSRSAA